MESLTDLTRQIHMRGLSLSALSNTSVSTVGRSKVNCPNCNSLQEFAPKVRMIGPDMYERFGGCKVCNHTVVLEVLTGDAYRELQKGKRRANRRRNAARRRARRAG